MKKVQKKHPAISHLPHPPPQVAPTEEDFVLPLPMGTDTIHLELF